MSNHKGIAPTQFITDCDKWNHALAQIPRAHVLQTWQWGEFKARYGWTPTRVMFHSDAPPFAAAQILRRNFPRTPFGILYAPRGPAFDNTNPAHFESALAALEAFARQQRAIFIKIDPDLERESAVASLLDKRGWHYSNDQIQFRNTLVLDLTPTEDELLAGMKPKWRYNIRLAAKRGVSVEAGTRDQLADFYKLYAETSARDSFLIRPFDYYRRVWTALLDAGLAQMLFARVGAELVAGLMLFTFAQRAWYFYGASRNTHRDTMPNHLLQWEAIRWAKAHGCAEYDFWGAPEKFDGSDPMFGVYRFKEGFGARVVQTVGAHDYVVNPALYFLYTRVYPWYVERLRRRHELRMPNEE